nr:FAD-dependent monooxygenase [Mycolicibacterium malmesburyense]CRL67207.1 2-polyprenyl-6-methoxyphenol hydroxylase-like oxidoreductase [Mycolicibacterium malmesburyense]
MTTREAVVCGASMGGLLAARVLSDAYDSVTVVERDSLPDDVSQRAGVPQGHHLHMLMSLGLTVLEELIPGATTDLRRAGAPVIDTRDLSAVYFEVRGHALCRTKALDDPDAIPVQAASRPLLESVVRERVCALPNVKVLDGHDVVEPVLTDGAVTGVHIVDRTGAHQTTLSADLVVDATGRSARTPAFLAAHGFTRPVERSYRVQLSYTSQLFRLSPEALADRVVFVSPTRERPTGVGMLAYEDDTMIVTLIGVAGYQLPTRLPEMLAAVAECVPPKVSAALAKAEPVGETHHRQFPTSVWRRYDKLPSFPHGLLVIGDAVCSLNPMYGQGMTAALLQAQSLRETLAAEAAPVSRDYFREVARKLAPFWWANRLNDFAFLPTSGWKAWPQRALNGYVTAYMTAASTDIALSETFLRMLQGVDPGTILMRPGNVARVLAHARENHDRQ